MKIYFTFFSLIFFVNVLLSQTSFDYSVVNFDVIKKINVGDQNDSNVSKSSSLSSLKGIIGSPYRNSSFEVGIIYKNKDSVKTFLRYNGLNDEIEISSTKDATSSKNAVIKSKFISCRIKNDLFIFKDFIDENKYKNNGYLIRAYSGEKYSLYVRDKKVFIDGEKAKNSLEGDKPPKFIDKQTIFIQYKSDLPRPTKLKYKKIAELIANEDQPRLAKLKNSYRKINSLDRLISLISNIDK